MDFLILKSYMIFERVYSMRVEVVEWYVKGFVVGDIKEEELIDGC